MDSHFRGDDIEEDGNDIKGNGFDKSNPYISGMTDGIPVLP